MAVRWTWTPTAARRCTASASRPAPSCGGSAPASRYRGGRRSAPRVRGRAEEYPEDRAHTREPPHQGIRRTSTPAFPTGVPLGRAGRRFLCVSLAPQAGKCTPGTMTIASTPSTSQTNQRLHRHLHFRDEFLRRGHRLVTGKRISRKICASPLDPQFLSYCVAPRGPTASGYGTRTKNFGAAGNCVVTGPSTRNSALVTVLNGGFEVNNFSKPTVGYHRHL